MRNRMTMVVATVLGAAAFLGCDDGSAQTASRPASEPLPAGLIVATALADAKDVGDVRKSAGDGDEVVVRGRVGGEKEPFVEGRAAFQLVDMHLRTCVDEGEACPTPWDYCCTPRDQISAGSLTVQVVGPTGQPLRAELKGTGGLKPLSEVSVKGKVKKSPDGKAVMVNATELHVKQG